MADFSSLFFEKCLEINDYTFSYCPNGFTFKKDQILFKKLTRPQKFKMATKNQYGGKKATFY
jgi:hypothetical protein